MAGNARKAARDGAFVHLKVRLRPALHAKLKKQAARDDWSMNRELNEIVESYCSASPVVRQIYEMQEQIEKEFGYLHSVLDALEVPTDLRQQLEKLLTRMRNWEVQSEDEYRRIRRMEVAMGFPAPAPPVNDTGNGVKGGHPA